MNKHINQEDNHHVFCPKAKFPGIVEIHEDSSGQYYCECCNADLPMTFIKQEVK